MKRRREYFDKLLESNETRTDTIEQNNEQLVIQKQHEQTEKITEKELTAAVNKIKIGKALGYGETIAEMVRNTRVTRELLDIINQAKIEKYMKSKLHHLLKCSK